MKRIQLIKEDNSIEVKGKDIKKTRDDGVAIYNVLTATGTKDTSDFRSKVKLKKAVEDVLVNELKMLDLGLTEFKILGKIMEDYKSQVLKKGETIHDSIMQVMIQIEDAEQVDEKAAEVDPKTPNKK